MLDVSPFTTTMSGSLNSTPNSNFLLEFFQNDACDAQDSAKARGPGHNQCDHRRER